MKIKMAALTLGPIDLKFIVVDRKKEINHADVKITSTAKFL